MFKAGDKVEITHKWWKGVKGKVIETAENYGSPSCWVTRGPNTQPLLICNRYLKKI